MQAVVALFSILLPAAVLGSCCFPSWMNFDVDVKVKSDSFKAKMQVNYLKNRVVVDYNSKKVSYKMFYDVQSKKGYNLHDDGKCEAAPYLPFEMADQCIPDEAKVVGNLPGLNSDAGTKTYQFMATDDAQVTMSVSKDCIPLKSSVLVKSTSFTRDVTYSKLSNCGLDQALFDKSLAKCNV